ncbi:sialate O-acetylesterase [Shewanella algae]|uniref:sialate O-acetylesterase n=1 Tax=Shewanella algae TaxID=38313 RepID=UPI001AAFB15A|nr:sialate O-acetylesterase [Shewanella algae]MBO2698101.1 hypothetical protein [Shewanella algae]
MHPLRNGSQAVARPAAKPLTGLPGWFTESGDNNIPSYPGADWFNHVIAEFTNALAATGVVFDPTKDDHLEQAFSYINNAVSALNEPEVMDFNYENPWRKLSDYTIGRTTWAFLQTGQSLAGGGVGNDPTPEVKPAKYPNNIQMLSPQPVIDGLAQMSDTLIALEESSRVTIGSSWMQGVYEEENVDCIFSGQAYGGQAYSAIKKGGTTGIYERCIQQVGYVMAVKPYAEYKGISVIHGEQDGLNNNVNYAANIIEWATNFNTDIKAITGTSANIPLLFSQTATAGGYGFNGGIDETTFPTPIQQLMAHKNSSLCHLVCSTYHLEYYDHSHLTNQGQVRLGEYFEKAFLSLINNGNWSPLMPASISTSGNIITITFSGAVGALVFDETLVSPIANKGFSYRDDSANTITNVAINGSNQVEITVSGIAENAVIAYGYHNGAGGAANQIAGLGDRGNLRDSDPATSKYSTDRLYNWCVIFREEI